MIAIDRAVVSDYVIGCIDDYVSMWPTTNSATTEVDMELGIVFVKLHPANLFIIATC